MVKGMPREKVSEPDTQVEGVGSPQSHSKILEIISRCPRPGHACSKGEDHQLSEVDELANL